LPPQPRARAVIILVSPRKPDAATAANAGLLGQFLAHTRVFNLPWLGAEFDPAQALKDARVRKTLAALTKA
jgi:hypothetical protein